MAKLSEHNTCMRLRQNTLVIGLFLLSILVLAGCLPIEPDMISDLQQLSQSPLTYLNPDSMNNSVVGKDHQQAMNTQYTEWFFTPWTGSFSSRSGDVRWEFDRYIKNPGFGENKLPRSKEWVEELLEKAHLQSYPNVKRRAITIHNTNLRLLPTEKPLFNSFELAGEGFPFDTLQNSGLPANVPIYVYHITQDRSWAYIESPYASGWIPAADLAWTNDKFIKLFRHNYFASIIKDHTTIHDPDTGAYLYDAFMGMQFPVINENDSGFTVLVAVSDRQQATLRKLRISKTVASRRPLKLTQQKIAELAQELMNQPYGWGNLFDDRDCSSMLRDLFAPFGIWLPRNSSDQARSGVFISLKGLSPEDKEKAIIQNGIPYLTLIWLKGHIMLYVGSANGRAVAFHNIWGIRTKDFWGHEGRKVIGKAVITTLQPGRDLPNFDPEGDLLKRVEGITLLIPAN